MVVGGAMAWTAGSGIAAETRAQAIDKSTRYSHIRVGAEGEQLPSSTDDLIRLWSDDLDLMLPVQKGDSLALLLLRDNDGGSASQKLLAASLTVAGATARYYR